MTVAQHRRSLGLLPNGPAKEAWLPKDRVRLVHMHMDGLPISEIAKRLGRSERSVSHACFRFGLRRNAIRTEITPQNVREMKRMRRDGLTYTEIGEHFGCSHTTIMRRLNGDRRKR